MAVNPQTENGFVRIANEIWDEIIRRDFSKRQKDILQFILRLSYGCNRKFAYIPLLKDFSLCGVTANHITEELNFLKSCKVIDWNRDDMFFAFNKNYEVWQMQPVKKWNDERFRELVHINITSQFGNFPKQELPKTGRNDFPKKEVEEDEIPCGSKDEEVSKDSIKDITTTTKENRTIEQAYIKVFNTAQIGSSINEIVFDYLQKGFTETFLIEVILEAGESSATKPNARYIRSIAESWEKDGIYTRVEAKKRRDAFKNNGQVIKHPNYKDQEAYHQERIARERENLEPIEYPMEDFIRERIVK